ncbi:MAG: hypothetical protein ACKVII_12960 [Planctomycetales bacterium]
MEAKNAENTTRRARWLKWDLLWWQLRPLLLISLAGCVLSNSLALLHPVPLLPMKLRDVSNPVILFVVVHCCWIAIAEGRYGSRSFGFLFAQGFSRRTLQGHSLLAAFISVMLVWLPLAAGVWTGFRSWLLDQWRNPWFPWAGPLESDFPTMVLLLYVVLIPSLRYAWIRAALPCRGGGSGIVVTCGILIQLKLTLTSRHVFPTPDRYGLTMLALLCLASLVLFVAGARLYDDIEVRT